MAYPQTPHDPQPYPLGLRLDGRRVLVVGGGSVATRRVPALLDAGRRRAAGRARGHSGAARPRRRRPAHLVAARASSRPIWTVPGWCTSRSTTRPRRRGQRGRRGAQIFCVRADDRDAATAWTPAVTRHGPVTVAVLGGGDPRRAMAVRDAIAVLPTPGETRPPARRCAAEPGRAVALVGAGPGDPELITVKGRRLLAEADVVVVDRLAPGLLLDELRPEVELVDASKIPYGPARPRRRSTASWSTGPRPGSSWCGSRAATRTSSAAAARSCWPAPRPASR